MIVYFLFQNRSMTIVGTDEGSGVEMSQVNAGNGKQAKF